MNEPFLLVCDACHVQLHTRDEYIGHYFYSHDDSIQGRGKIYDLLLLAKNREEESKKFFL